jgi:hypothetical protein
MEKKMKRRWKEEEEEKGKGKTSLPEKSIRHGWKAKFDTNFKVKNAASLCLW